MRGKVLSRDWRGEESKRERERERERFRSRCGEVIECGFECRGEKFDAFARRDFKIFVLVEVFLQCLY